MTTCLLNLEQYPIWPTHRINWTNSPNDWTKYKIVCSFESQFVQQKMICLMKYDSMFTEPYTKWTTHRMNYKNYWTDWTNGEISA